MAAHYSSHYLGRFWQFLFGFEDSGGEEAAELKHQHQQELDAIPRQQKAHGVLLSDILKWLSGPPAHDDSGSAGVDGSAAGGTAVAAVDSASCSCSVVGFGRTVGGAPVCAEPPEDSLAAYSAQGSDGAAADD